LSVSYQNYIDTIKSPISQRLLKIEILDSNYNIINTITPSIIDGNISFSSDSGARRSCNITFDNSDGSFIPNPEGQFWMNTMYQVFTGYRVNDEDYYFSRGIFVSGEPTVNSQFASQTVELQLYDQFTFLDGTLGGTIENTYIIPVGSDVETVVRQIFVDAGETRPVIFEPIVATTPYTLIVNAGDSYSQLLLKLAEMISYVVYYDNNGFPRFETPANDINNIFNAGSSFDFTTNEIIYLGARRKFEYSKVKNECVVIGANVAGSIYRATASDNNITSPTRIGLIGKRSLVIIDDLIYSTDLAQQRANYELQKAIQVLESVDVECVPIDMIEGDSIITISDNGLGVSGDRYLVRSVSFPLLNTGGMSLSVWLARSFS